MIGYGCIYQNVLYQHIYMYMYNQLFSPRLHCRVHCSCLKASPCIAYSTVAIVSSVHSVMWYYSG